MCFYCAVLSAISLWRINLSLFLNFRFGLVEMKRSNTGKYDSQFDSYNCLFLFWFIITELATGTERTDGQTDGRTRHDA